MTAIRSFLLLLLMFAVTHGLRAQIVDGGEYYIISDYYDMVLGLSPDGTTPRLSAYGTNADENSYVLVAEASAAKDYFYLRNKSTGQYLAASTSNTWSVVWNATRGTGDEYLWKLNVQFGRSIVNRKNTSTRLGCDWTEDASVPVYYDKAASSRARFHVVPALEEGYKASLAAAHTTEFVNSFGTNEQDYYSLSEPLTISSRVDLHLVSDIAPMDTLKANINITDRSAWVVFDNVRPDVVIDKYLKFISINGTTAKNGSNVRVAIFLDGAAVIPTRSSDMPFSGYAEDECQGSPVTLYARDYPSMKSWSNRIRSFTLKRGYMVTLATDESLGGYTRVFVADHADLVVNNLPAALKERISSIQIRPWQYVSKKGWCSTQSNSGIAGGVKATNASWFYTWSADRSSTANAEYVPIRQHIYWPSMTQIGGHTTSNHVLSFNEPDHSEQHNNCDCKGVIDPWTATTKTPEMAKLGMRVGSPAPTDASWLSQYIGHVDDMAYRCDFVAFHAYWGPNEANGVSAWYDRLKGIYDSTKRPIWLTEWAYGASWTTESWPSGYSNQLEKNRAAIMDIVDMFERTPFIERYSYYQWDTTSRRFINDDGWVTPAGHVYRKTHSTFAYNASYQKVPNWWTPSLKTPKLSQTISKDPAEITFTMVNGNGDLTASMQLQQRTTDGVWKTVYEVEQRNLYDQETLTTTLPLCDVDTLNDAFRLVVVRNMGDTAVSNIVSSSPLRNPDCTDGLTGWTTSELSTNKGEASDGNAANTYWDQWKPSGLKSSMSQTLKDLPAGEYVVSALLRGGTNVSITLSAGDQSSTITGSGSASLDGSPWLNGWSRVELPSITVEQGGQLTITASAQGEGSAWWSADDFTLVYTPDPALAIGDVPTSQSASDTRAYTLDGRPVNSAAAPRCILVSKGRKRLN